MFPIITNFSSLSTYERKLPNRLLALPESSPMVEQDTTHLVSQLLHLLLVLILLLVCVCCRKEKHPLYTCAKFRALSHDDNTLKSKGLCLNCLRPGHYVRDCASSHRRKKCHKPHHTLLHVEAKDESPVQTPPVVTPISSNVTMGIQSNTLLMTCCLMVEAPDGSTTQARAILDSASSASFSSELSSHALTLKSKVHWTTSRLITLELMTEDVSSLCHGSQV